MCHIRWNKRWKTEERKKEEDRKCVIWKGQKRKREGKNRARKGEKREANSALGLHKPHAEDLPLLNQKAQTVKSAYRAQRKRDNLQPL